MRLESKTVLITGISGGIGSAIARAFLDEGAYVGGTYFKTESYIQGASTYQCDIREHEQVREVVEDFTAKHNSIDILVNNAGMWKPDNFESLNLEDWLDIININLTGHYYFVRNVLPYMKKQGSGNIIFISSRSAINGDATCIPYTAAKGGMISFAKALAKEFGRYGIRVNSISPGWIDTRMSRMLLENNINSALGRIGRPEEVARVAVNLASDDFSYVNGQNIIIDGG